MKLNRLFIFFILFIALPFSKPVRHATLELTSSPQWSPLIITSPTTLTPLPDPVDPLCRTYWYIIDNAGGYPVYLTLNVTDQGGSTNSGEWRPNIPTNGFYKIEVYIPDHGTINWNCNSSNFINQDTNHAEYTVTSPIESKNVIVDQIAGTWVSLGNFYLTKGIGNAVSLSDVTGELNFEYLVSFSMARFTWVPSQTSLFLPTIYKDYGPAFLTKVTLDSVTPYTRDWISRLRFDMDEPVMYRITGTNGFNSPENVRLTWQYVGPCGSTPEAEVSLSLPVGSWTYDLNTAISTCPGQNLINIRIYSRTAILQKSLNISVDPGGTLQLFQGAAFDVCHLPSIDAMRAWWTNSPYSVVNIYMGGISFASGCNYAGLSRDWIKNVQNIGWGYIPTWVGPQAPCSDLKYKFSFDPATAYNQGKQEAVSAVTKAIQLGLVEASNADSVIYYDMEGYSYAINAKDPVVRAQCRSVVKEFLRGWVEQIHAYGILAGGYGGSYSSYMSDWWSITPRPDIIWAAEWYSINDEYQYDPNASVTLKYLSDSYWPTHQRVHQYAGDHYEIWGGNQLAIDSDVSDTTLLLTRIPVVKPPISADINSVGESQVSDFHFFSPDQGWLLDRGALYWTHDGGLSWQLITQPTPPGDRLAKAFFTNPSQGWLLASSESGYTLFSTADGGVTWQFYALPDYGPVEPIEFKFVDSLNGTVKFRFQTSQAFREGYVLTTVDGGLTWQRGELAQDDPAWEQAIELKSAAGELPAPAGSLQVQWLSSTDGWARVFRGACNGGGQQSGYVCQSAVVLETTSDGGQTWQVIYP